MIMKFFDFFSSFCKLNCIFKIIFLRDKIMLNFLAKALRKRKLQVVKPFSSQIRVESLKFTFCAYNLDIATHLKNAFDDVSFVEVVCGNIFDLDCDALVSPANSFADMSGGLDKAIDDFYKGKAQHKFRETLQNYYFGELPVGVALVFYMQHPRFPYLIVSPTMRTPGKLDANSINVYLAMRALLVAVLKHNSSNSQRINSIAIPSLGTGVGGVSFQNSAEQMRVAFDNIIGGKWKTIVHPAMAPYAFPFRAKE